MMLECYVFTSALLGHTVPYLCTKPTSETTEPMKVEGFTAT